MVNFGDTGGVDDIVAIFGLLGPWNFVRIQLLTLYFLFFFFFFFRLRISFGWTQN